MNSDEVIVTEAGESRELASRENDGVHVVLNWHPADGAVSVSVDDSRVGRRFELVVENRLALDAFYHPFAYAA